LHDDVVVIAHHRKSAQLHGKHAGEQLHPIDDPLAAVLEVISRERILPAQKRPAHAA
jgi:hypothetical protein